MEKGRYANVIVDISHEKVDRPFQYKIPDDLCVSLSPGSFVKVPFGTGNRMRQGYVVEITDQPQYPPEKLKEIAGLVKNGVSAESDAIKLAAFIKENYGSTMIAALKTVLPVKQSMKPKEKRKITRLASVNEITSLLGESIRKHQVAKARVMSELLKEPVLPYELVTGKLNVSSATLRSLENQRVLSIETENYYRNPVKLETAKETGKQLSSSLFVTRYYPIMKKKFGRLT